MSFFRTIRTSVLEDWVPNLLLAFRCKSIASRDWLLSWRMAPRLFLFAHIGPIKTQFVQSFFPFCCFSRQKKMVRCMMASSVWCRFATITICTVNFKSSKKVQFMEITIPNLMGNIISTCKKKSECLRTHGAQQCPAALGALGA